MILILLIIIFQSDETDEIIKQLGDNSYYKREIATEKLVLYGRKIFPKLEEVKNTTTNPEIKYRCEQVKIRYYSIVPNDLSIWMLPMEHRFITKEEETIDIAQQYFTNSENKYIELHESLATYDTRVLADNSRLATKQYFIDQLNSDEISREELIILIKKMKNNTQKIQKKYGKHVMRPDLFYITEPIEYRLSSNPSIFFDNQLP